MTTHPWQKQIPRSHAQMDVLTRRFDPCEKQQEMPVGWYRSWSLFTQTCLFRRQPNGLIFTLNSHGGSPGHRAVLCSNTRFVPLLIFPVRRQPQAEFSGTCQACSWENVSISGRIKIIVCQGPSHTHAHTQTQVRPRDTPPSPRAVNILHPGAAGTPRASA